jgi:hypothetical protein
MYRATDLWQVPAEEPKNLPLLCPSHSSIVPQHLVPLLNIISNQFSPLTCYSTASLGHARPWKAVGHKVVPFLSSSQPRSSWPSLNSFWPITAFHMTPLPVLHIAQVDNSHNRVRSGHMVTQGPAQLRVLLLLFHTLTYLPRVLERSLDSPKVSLLPLQPFRVWTNSYPCLLHHWRRFNHILPSNTLLLRCSNILFIQRSLSYD